MNKQAAITFIVFSCAAMALWFGLNYGYSNDRTQLSSNAHEETQTKNVATPTKVTGLNGEYPRYIDNQNLSLGDVEMPESYIDPQDAYDAKAEAWAKVDFEAIKTAMPDNQFWEMAMPTGDENVLATRQEKRNLLKIIEAEIAARHATEGEIRAYYDQQQMLSEDYVEAITVLLNKYGDVLPEEDYSGQTLARMMHLAKLQELPSKVTRALEERQKFVSQRTEWLENRAEYEARLHAEATQARKALGKI